MKKLLLSIGTIMTTIVPIITVESCGVKTTIKVTPRLLIDDTRIITETSNYALNEEAETNKGWFVDATVTPETLAKKINLVTQAEIKTPVKDGYLYTIEGIIIDGLKNTILNVRISVKRDGQERTFKYVSSIPGFVAPEDNFQKGIIIASFGDSNNERWIKAIKVADETSSRSGFEIKTSNFSNTESQASAIKPVVEGATAKKPVKGISLSPFEAGAGGIVGTFGVTKDGKELFPIVAYDRLIVSDAVNYNWYTTFDNTKVGNIQGLSLAAGLVGSEKPFKSIAEMENYVKANKNKIELATFLTLAGSPDDNNAELFYNGAMDVLNKLMAATDKVKYVGPNTFGGVAVQGWKDFEAQSKLTTNIVGLSSEDRKNIKGVLAPCDGFSLAAQNALSSQKIEPTKVFITGQDANDTGLASIKFNEGVNMTISKPDLRLTAINVSVIEAINESKKSDEYRVLTDKNDKDNWIFEYVKTKNPTIEISLHTNNKVYKTAANKTIKTILLTPTLINKANIDANFTITKTEEK